MAKVLFKRVEDSALIDNFPVEDGTFWVTGDGKTYVDYGENRIPTNGTPDNTMSNISTNTVQNKVIKQYVDNAINNAKVELNGTLLWTNEHPISGFEPQQVTLSSSDYDTIEIYYMDYRGTLNMSSVRAVKGNNISMPTVIMIGNQGYVGVRTCEFINSTTLDFNYANAIIQNNAINVATNVTDWCVPIYIVGYKTNLNFD